MRPVTIKDIAKEAKVSTTTVSLVLNNKSSRISKEKKEEIFEIAKRLNYRPNLNARALASSTTNMIGFIIPDIENPFFASLAKVIESNLRDNHYSVMLTNTDDNFENEISAIRSLNNKGVDGFIIILSNESYQRQEEIKEILDSIKKPFILVDRVFKDSNYNQVSFDNYEGQLIATNYLISRGYKDISYIAPPRNSFTSKDRINGFKDSLLTNNIGVDNSKIINGNYRFKSGYDIAEELVNLGSKAIVVSNDIMAYGAIKKISEMGKKIPKDIAVVGYDDLLYSNMSLVSLTTVKQDNILLANESTNLLLEVIKDESIRKQIVLKPELVIRNSTL